LKRRRRLKALPAALALLALAAGTTPARAVDLEGGRSVRHLRIEGNEAFSDGRLKSLLRTRGRSLTHFWRSHPYRPDFIRFDQATLLQYYRRWGYMDARSDSVSVDPVSKGSQDVDVTFHLVEGPRAVVDAVELIGVDSTAAAEIRKKLTLRKGDFFDAVKLESDRQRIEDRYANLGYAAVSVRDSLEIDSARVRILHRVRPGLRARVGTVTVEGNRETRQDFVVRELLLHRGDWLARERLAASQQRIYDSGYYTDVQFERGPIDSTTHVAALFVTVRERKLAWVDLGLGYGTLDKLRITTEWGNRNLFHTGMRFSISGKTGVHFRSHPLRAILGDKRADISLSQPWFLHTRTRATLGAYAEQTTPLRPGDLPKYRAAGGTFTLQRDLWRHTRGAVSLENRYVISDSSSADSALVALGAISSKERYTTNRVTTVLERDSRTDIFDPKGGSDVLASVEVAGGALQGNTQLVKTTTQGSVYLHVRGRATLAMRVRAGYVWPFGRESGTSGGGVQGLDFIPLVDRFRTGGATTVRGYFENDLGTRTYTVEAAPDSFVTVTSTRGGEVLLLGSVELRFPVGWIVSGALFLDAGNVWDKASDLTLRRVFSPLAPGAGYQDMRYSFGGGLRFKSPVGPIRVDYGYKLRSTREDQRDLNPRRGAFHFSLGQAF
jgi:outer membrane protein insertion porin family